MTTSLVWSLIVVPRFELPADVIQMPLGHDCGVPTGPSNPGGVPTGPSNPVSHFNRAGGTRSR